ncbi:MAG: acyloxyacyl hydrolase [Pseudomonadota bacterium]|nr:acyloxyacyl hydrolase [Pseudomonadota bacterium]
MSYKTTGMTALLAAGVLAFVPCHAQEGLSVGVRAGVNIGSENEDFERYEVIVRQPLPWRWQPADRWLVASELSATAGALSNGDTTGFVGWVGPGVRISRAGPLSLDLGVGVAWLSQTRFGQEDLTSEIQFISYAGLNYRLGSRWSADFRFEHLSNAGIEEPNPGLNTILLGINYHF